MRDLAKTHRKNTQKKHLPRELETLTGSDRLMQLLLQPSVAFSTLFGGAPQGCSPRCAAAASERAAQDFGYRVQGVGFGVGFRMTHRNVSSKHALDSH